MATFKLRANSLSGLTGLTVRLYALPGSAIANGAGGDALAETADSDGEFAATVSQSLSGLHYYAVYRSGVPIYDGQVLCDGSTWTADQATTLDESAVALAVYRRLSGGAVALVARPTEGDPLDVVRSADLSLSIDAETADDSVLVFTVRRCRDDDTAELEVASDVGLSTLAGDDWPTAGDGSVTRTSSSVVTVDVVADALSNLSTGRRFAELREIKADGSVASLYELELVIRSTAGRRVA